jgi:hypothetical protein
MQFGICVMAEVGEIDFFTHAESLGYDSVWVTDSQMIFSDCYAVLALAATATERIRLGTGTSICGTRLPARARGGHGHAEQAAPRPGASWASAPATPPCAPWASAR